MDDSDIYCGKILVLIQKIDNKRKLKHLKFMIY